MPRFNSLQTGKAFRTKLNIILMYMIVLVSIPFKRERLSERLKWPHHRVTVGNEFQFPSKREKAFRTN